MSRPDIPVTISGDPRGFESALDRVRRATKTSVSDIAASFVRVQTAIAGPIGLLAGLSAGGVVTAIRETARAVAEVGDEAQRAGLSVESFQELKFVAEQNRIGIDALIDGIKELNLRADEFVVTGGGSAAEAFKRIGLGAESLRDKLKDPSALLAEIIGRVQVLDRSAQIRVFDEMFGGAGGEQFVQLIGQGEKGIRDTVQAANDLGLVMDKELFAKAAAVDRQFNLIATTVSVRLKGAVIEAASAMQGFLSKYNEYQERRNIAEAGAAIGGMYGQPITVKPPVSTPAAPKGDRLPSATDILRDKLIEQRINEAFGDVPVGSSAGGSREKSTAAAKKEKSAYDDVIESLREEVAVMNLSDSDRERILTLRQAGVEASTKEGKEILTLIDLKAQQVKAEEAVTEARERAKEAADRLGQTLDDQLMRIVDGTFDARDAIAALLEEMISVGTQGKSLFGSIFEALSGGNGLNLFGGSASGSGFKSTTTLSDILGYGGLRAGGGDVSPGRVYRINEYEQEFFAPTNHGRIVAPSKLSGTSAADQEATRSVVEIHLSDGLVGTILQQSKDQSVSLIRSNNAARQNLRENGGDV